MSSNHNIGLHLRLKDTLSNMIQEALTYNIKAFQFFLIAQNTDKYISPSNQDKEIFLKAKNNHLMDIFIHSSYWINPAASNKEIFAISKHLLKKEIKLAKELHINYLVLHAGSAKGHRVTTHDPLGKQKGIQTLATMLNTILKNEQDIKILLENSAHGKSCIGNDFEDFALLKNKLDYPEKVRFCVDFAHAFSYGYGLWPVEDFACILDKTIGLEAIELIHFNDLKDTQGSMQDRHAFPGHGEIGKETMIHLLNYSAFKNIPKIIEGPDHNNESTFLALQEILTWPA